jgi:hypothetical protein
MQTKSNRNDIEQKSKKLHHRYNYKNLNGVILETLAELNGNMVAFKAN